MDKNKIVFREGTKEDCDRIAELNNIASGGVLDFLFRGLVFGMTPVQVAASNLKNDNYPHTYKNTVVAEHDSTIVGFSLSYPSKYHAITEDMRNFLPPDRLEHFKHFFSSRVEDSYFLDALSVDEKCRNRGIGTELISRTKQKAQKAGFKTLSLIVFADNEKARLLYEKTGFVTVKHIEVKPHTMIPHKGGCLLMRHDLLH